MSESSKANAATAAAASAPQTPELHDADLVAVKVIYKGGVNAGSVAHVDDGRPYKFGEHFVTNRAHARRQKHALEIVSTVWFRNAPDYVKQRDPGLEPGPIDIGPRQA